MPKEMSVEANNYLKRAWHARDGIYHELFGPHKYALPKKYEAPEDAQTADVNMPSELAAIAGKSLTYKDVSIVAYEPNEQRPYWILATSGLSNPWFGQSDDVSGFGCELVMKTKTAGRWSFKLMRRLVYYIISYAGTLSPGVTLKMDLPLFAEGKSEMGGIAVWYADEAPDCIYQLPTGQFGIFTVIGITADEADFAASDEYGCWFVQQILREGGGDQRTEPNRVSIMKHPQIGERLSSLRNYLENFGFSAGQK